MSMKCKVHRSPSLIGLSASHNVLSDKQSATDTVLMSLIDYYKCGASCISIKYNRFSDNKADHVDENKFLMELDDNLLVMVPQLFKYVGLGLRVNVVGSKEVGIVVDTFKEFCLSKYNFKPDIKLVPEGETSSSRGMLWSAGYAVIDNIVNPLNKMFTGKPLVKGNLRKVKKYKLSLSTSMKESMKLDELSPLEMAAFSPLDVPCATNDIEQMLDKDLDNYNFLMHLNPQKSTFYKGQKLFTRNFYTYLINENNQQVWCKEPQLYLISREALPIVTFLGDVFYGNRQKGQLSIKKAMLSPFKDVSFIRKMLFDKNGSKAKWGLHYFIAETLGYFILGGHPVRLKAKHNDPFLLRDIDAVHDLNYYRALVKHAKDTGRDYDGLEDLFLFGKQVCEFKEYVKGIRGNIGVLKDFGDNEKVMSYHEKRFNDYFKRLESPEFIKKSKISIDDVKNIKAIMNQQLNNYLSKTALPDENIYLSNECLKENIKQTKEIIKKYYKPIF